MGEFDVEIDAAQGWEMTREALKAARAAYGGAQKVRRAATAAADEASKGLGDARVTGAGSAREAVFTERDAIADEQDALADYQRALDAWRRALSARG